MIGFFLSILGILLLLSSYIAMKRNQIFEQKNKVLFQTAENHETVEIPDITEEEKKDIPTPTSESNSENTSTNSVNQNYYLGYLEIPKINLKKGFVDKNSKDNDVSKNITILSTAAYPDQENGNFILAAHSGTGAIAYFNELYRLEIGDTAIITYHGKRYTYQFVDIYTQAKTGTAAIYRNMNKNVLTLITCTNNDDRKQSIYIAELISVE